MNKIYVSWNPPSIPVRKYTVTVTDNTNGKSLNYNIAGSASIRMKFINLNHSISRLIHTLYRGFRIRVELSKVYPIFIRGEITPFKSELFITVNSMMAKQNLSNGYDLTPNDPI